MSAIYKAFLLSAT